MGFCEENSPLDIMLGWLEGSWGYHGDDGKVFDCRRGSTYGPVYDEGAVIGCGVNFKEETAFYTVNGEVIGMSHIYRRYTMHFKPSVLPSSIGRRAR